jgi:hypothetical protein
MATSPGDQAVIRHRVWTRPIPWDGVKRAKEALEALASIVTIIGSGVLAAAFFVLFVREAFDKSIMIEPLSVPKSLADEGFSSDVSTDMLHGQLQAMVAASTANDELRLSTNNLGASAIQNDLGSLDVSIPGVGVSLEALAREAASIVGGHRHVLTGDFTLLGGKLLLDLRLDGVPIIDGRVGDPQYPGTLLLLGTRNFIYKTNPTALANYFYETKDTNSARRLAQHIVSEEALKPRQRARAYILLGLMSGDSGDNAEVVRNYAKAISLGAKRSWVNDKFIAACESLGKTPDPSGQNKDALSLCHV